MKTTIKICLATVTVSGLSTLSTLAVPVTPLDITLSYPLGSSSVLVNDFAANDLSAFGPGKSPAAELGWLQQDVFWYDHNYAGSLVAPPDQMGIGENTSSAVTVAAGDYLVLHYGSGPGGTSGGGAVGLFFDAAGTYDIPQIGSGPNGFGGISSANLFGPGSGGNVPDGGSTALFLGLALSVLGLIQHKLG